MTGKKVSNADIRRLTNLDDLIGRQTGETVPSHPPLETTDAEPIRAKRSTNDPFEINFANVDIIEGLGKKSVKPAVRWFAWIFLAGPFLLIWPFAIYFILEGASADVKTFGDLLSKLIVCALVSLGCGFWPYMLLRRN